MKRLHAGIILFWILITISWFALIRDCAGAEEFPECKIEIINLCKFETYCFLLDGERDIMVDDFPLSAYKELGDRVETILAPGIWVFASFDDEVDFLDYQFFLVVEGAVGIGKDEDKIRVYDCTDPVQILIVPKGESM